MRRPDKGVYAAIRQYHRIVPDGTSLIRPAACCRPDVALTRPGTRG
ncbi:hypothetical protein ACQP3L_29350 [Escherichia coli]